MRPRPWLLAAALLAGCAARTARPTPPPPPVPVPEPVAAPEDVIELEPLRVEVVPNEKGEPTVVAVDARSLFDDANEHLVGGRHDEALRLYDELLSDFPESALAAPALYNAGLAHEGKGDHDAALERYRTLIRRVPTGRDSIDAHVRLGAVLAERERWSEAIAAFEELLDRDDLTPSDRIEGLARLGYVRLESKDYAGAEEMLRSGLAYHEEIKATAHLETDYYVAMCQYYLGQIPHRQFTALPIRLPDKQMERDIEAKSELVILAHDRYVKTLEMQNGFWATAAGYQLAMMQKEFWDALVLAPIPPQLSKVESEVYVEEVHKLARRFLEKAVRYHTKTVELAERAGITTPWSQASRKAATEIADVLAREARGEIVVPSAGAPAEPTSTDPAGYMPRRIDL